MPNWFEPTVVTMELGGRPLTIETGVGAPAPCSRLAFSGPTDPPDQNPLKAKIILKNLLDNGAHGIIAPFIETPEQVRDLITAMRYPQPPDAIRPGPLGQRGSSPSRAARFWGLSRGDYVATADLWGLSPRGEMLNILLIENQLGVENIREIVQVPGVSIVMAATGDLNVNYGGDARALEQAVQEILAACKQYDVPCAIPGSVDDIEERIRQGFRVFLAAEDAIRVGHAAAGRN